MGFFQPMPPADSQEVNPRLIVRIVTVAKGEFSYYRYINVAI
jgi:hypothetical protein